MTRPDSSHLRVRSPLLPTWGEARFLLNVWDGVPRALIDNLRTVIVEQTGTPQAQVDWSNPDEWIPARLSGAEHDLAQRVWIESNRTVNPRHLYGSMLFTRLHNLIVTDSDDISRVTDRGRAFLTEGSAVEREIDEIEGIPNLLRLIAKKNRPKRQDLLPDWSAYLAKHSRFGKQSTIKSTLAYRVRNAMERGLLERDGSAYTVTRRGRAYLDRTADETDDRQRLLDAVDAFNEKQKRTLRETLLAMHPYAFEHLVRDLLTEMGYEDATVTKQTGDKGIDVVANVQVGITNVREVVQVKRVQGNLSRRVLDELRGVLPFHGAIRGTVITTGGFSKGCTDVATYPGAAPLTLIDGDRLIDLLIQHSVGVTRESVEMLELTGFEGDEEADEPESV